MLKSIRELWRAWRPYVTCLVMALVFSMGLVDSGLQVALPTQAAASLPAFQPDTPTPTASEPIAYTATPPVLASSALDQPAETERDILRHEAAALSPTTTPPMVGVVSTETPTNEPTVAEVEAEPDPIVPPTQLVLENVGEIVQTRNNCGPASVAMVLAYYGQVVSQAEAESVLKPDPEAWGMLPNVVPAYIKDFGLAARVLEGGTLDDLKALLRAGIPVIVGQWLSDAEPIPHYRVVIGYDDTTEAFLVNDGVLGFHQPLAYTDFVSLWDVYNNLYLPVFRSEDAEQVHSLLADGWDKTVLYVTLAHSRPEWDALLSSGMPTAEAESTVEAVETPRSPNITPDAAWPLAYETVDKGQIDGSAAGAFAFYTVAVDTPGSSLILHYTPDDPVIGQGFGFKVYDAQGKVVGEGVNTTGQVGERRVSLPTTPGSYLIQVYNYLPDVHIEFELTWQ